VVDVPVEAPAVAEAADEAAAFASVFGEEVESALLPSFEPPSDEVEPPDSDLLALPLADE
jgi:hypothetical protein